MFLVAKEIAVNKRLLCYKSVLFFPSKYVLEILTDHSESIAVDEI